MDDTNNSFKDALAQTPAATPSTDMPTASLPQDIDTELKAQKPHPMMKRAVIATALTGVWCGTAALGVMAICAQDLPNPETLWTPTRPASIHILDRYGRPLLVRGSKAGPPVNIEDLPDYVSKAFLATEDRKFYRHVGIEPLSLLRATLVNLRAGKVVQGGSTLTQQLSKNIFLTPERSLKRKVQELMLSLWLEHKFTKNEIFNMYLNRVYFGDGMWGLSAAAQNYFGKQPDHLSMSEAALLAGMLKAPSRYNPRINPQISAKRTATVLGVMQKRDMIDRWDHYTALSDPIEIKPRISEESANYFVDWVWNDLEQIIDGQNRDLYVYTTLDRDIQKAAHAALNSHLDPKKDANQGSVITLDGTGAVRAMVGGRSYSKSQFNRAVQANRQPGSAFKPFVYLSAFRQGLTPWDIREDSPVEIGDWKPKNFNEKYLGYIRLESAFAYSVNTVAIALGEEIGRGHISRTAKQFGLKDVQNLPSLALGSQVTTPLALTAAYLPFANWGQSVNPYGIVSVSTLDGTPIYTRETSGFETIINADNLGHMNRIMRATVERGSGRRAAIKGREVGGKTGTTNDFRDAWFVGYVPDLVTSVWVGNDDFTPMKEVTGGQIPAQIFKDVMSTALQGTDFVPLPISRKPVAKAPRKKLDKLLKTVEAALP